MVIKKWKAKFEGIIFLVISDPLSPPPHSKQSLPKTTKE
jgi:hypothetical protein